MTEIGAKRIPTGEIRGILKVIKHLHNSIYLCECAKCGAIHEVQSRLLSPREIKHKCIQCHNCHEGTERHGLTDSRLYKIWRAMKNRENNHDSARPTYKGKKMCDEWKNSFTKFYDWAISHGYNDNLSIDRIDNNKGYSPENCRFATPTQQVRNRSNTLHITYKGETKPLMEWCEILNLNYNTTWTRMHKYHWSAEKAFTKGVI